MCGISGILNFTKNTPISNALQNMATSMFHRGPDDEGYMLFNKDVISLYGNDSVIKNTKHIETSFSQKYKLGFAFRQLKIIDLSQNSHQPMSDISKKYHIVFNGEIYNYKEIKRELIGLGHSFFSNSDTEVILNAYKQWQTKALEKFNGMFAFAIYDIAKNEVFIARDRMGIKPLYFYKNSEQFIFSSTIKAIVDSKIYKAKINYEGLWQNFKFSIAQRPITSFQGIVALEPAHYLKINLNNNSIVKQQYWQIPTNTQDTSLSLKDSINRVEEALYNAVKYRLIADVEVGSFMSGGVDSTSISVIASKINPNSKALTLGFKEYAAFNEVNQAKDTAKLHNIQHSIQNIGLEEVLQNIKNITTVYDEPYRGLSANYMLGKMASENHLKVVLSGLGADELFGGYDVFKKIRAWQILQKTNPLARLIPNIHPKINKLKQLAKYKNIGQFYAHYYTLYNDSELENLFLSETFNTTDTITKTYYKNQKFTDDFEAISYYNLKSYISNHQLRAIDLSTMHFSVEGRIPMLDHNFIEMAYTIPTKYKIKNGVQKFIFKEVAKKHIAPSCINMQKKGLNLPLKNWMQTELKEFVMDTIHSLVSRNVFNNLEIDRILNKQDTNKIWQLVSTELWFQKFFD